MTARQAALNFEPGSEYLYSNTGYTLLATIVERATATPFAVFADANIFKPLGMTATHYHTDARRLVPGRALAYGGRAGQWTLNTPINERAGAGGVYSNLIDLQKWDENFYTGTVGGLETVKRIQTPGALESGKALTYAWGLTIGEYRGLPIVDHSGALGGYRAHLMRFPSAHTSIALLCNEGSLNTTRLVRQVADAVMDGQFTQMVPTAVPGGVAGSVLGRVPDSGTPAANLAYVGTYSSEEVGAVITVTADGNDVRFQRASDPSPVVGQMDGPVDHFTFRGMTVRFQRDAAGSVVALTIDAGRVRGIRFVRR
jgi:CubicO group peptidase (beta-lactamase class C family)